MVVVVVVYLGGCSLGKSEKLPVEKRHFFFLPGRDNFVITSTYNCLFVEIGEMDWSHSECLLNRRNT